MACGNMKCRHRTWCEIKTEEKIDSQGCSEFKIIDTWWRDKISGRRDAIRELADPDGRCPDDDFGEEDFDIGDLS